MPFLQLTLKLGRAAPGLYEDALFAKGALSVTLEDAADDPILEPAPGAIPLWPTVVLRALFESDVDADGIVEDLRDQFGNATPLATIELIEDRAWEREWLKDFHAMRFGQRLWVCPAGQRPADPDAVIVDLDPGLAFGTGTHPTTALCLEWLDFESLAGKSIIDYGCGSGILAIAALKLGANAAYCTDIDEQALLASHDNALRNGVQDRMQLVSDPAKLAPANIVIANILAAPLHELAPKLASLVRPGGHIVLSGLLEDQAPAVAQRYSPWFEIVPITYKNGWARVIGLRLANG